VLRCERGRGVIRPTPLGMGEFGNDVRPLGLDTPGAVLLLVRPLLMTANIFLARRAESGLASFEIGLSTDSLLVLTGLSFLFGVQSGTSLEKVAI
jgi:hypothetical protein